MPFYNPKMRANTWTAGPVGTKGKMIPLPSEVGKSPNPLYPPRELPPDPPPSQSHPSPVAHRSPVARRSPRSPRSTRPSPRPTRPEDIPLPESLPATSPRSPPQRELSPTPGPAVAALHAAEVEAAYAAVREAERLRNEILEDLKLRREEETRLQVEVIHKNIETIESMWKTHRESCLQREQELHEIEKDIHNLIKLCDEERRKTEERRIKTEAKELKTMMLQFQDYRRNWTEHLRAENERISRAYRHHIH